MFALIEIEEQNILGSSDGTVIALKSEIVTLMLFNLAHSELQ